VEDSANQILPPEVRGSLQGEALTFRNTVSSLAILMLVAFFVMYVILAILYENYLHPITVLSSLPVALFGGLLTLWLFGSEASLYAYIGMFMLGPVLQPCRPGTSGGCGCSVSFSPRGMAPGLFPSRMLNAFSCCSICLSRSGTCAPAV